MKHRKLWDAINALEDQSVRDSHRVSESMGKLAKSGHLEADLRERGDAFLAERVDKLAGRTDAQEGIHWKKIKEVEKEVHGLERRMVILEKQALDDEWADGLAKALKSYITSQIRGDIEAAQAAHDKQELDRLVDYIRSELPDGTAGMGETVTDIAIRRLKTYRAALQDIMRTEGNKSEMYEPTVSAYWFARNALEGRDALGTGSK